MNRPVILAFTVIALASTCVGVDFRPCKFTDTSIVRHRENITEQLVGIVEDNGEVQATLLMPEGNATVPGALISHSAIHNSTSYADLLRFAWALARAGAAVIVLKGTLEWDPPSDELVREPHLMACAGQWLLMNKRLDRQRLLLVGTKGRWGGGDTPFCMSGEKPCFLPTSHVGFGETSGPVESANTDRMLTIGGQLEIAQWAQRHLKLSKIDPEWLALVSENQPAK